LTIKKLTGFPKVQLFLFVQRKICHSVGW
jgi:hypothetical protein